jgi:hypothetical protein
VRQHVGLVDEHRSLAAAGERAIRNGRDGDDRDERDDEPDQGPAGKDRAEQLPGVGVDHRVGHAYARERVQGMCRERTSQTAITRDKPNAVAARPRHV